jgi:lactate dehydrogenase-like 2-hydroxyacid dehydrogenase
MNIVFLDADTMGNIDLVSEIETLGQYKQFGTTSENLLLERIKEANVIITNKVKINREVLAQCPQLNLICIAATGTNNIDLDAAKEYNIAVKNVSGYSTESVAQHTFSLIFGLLNHIRYFDQYIKDLNGYTQSPIFTSFDREFAEINGKTFGIVGLGAIGRRVASIAQLLGARVVYYSTSGKNNQQDFVRVELNELLSSSDIISIHAPLNTNTQNLFGLEEFKKMKSNAIIVNTGRGGIVIESELAIALDQNMIGGAALDVFEYEPIFPNNPLLKLKNPEKLILSPHIAWASIESRKRLWKGVLSNIKEFYAIR